MKAVAIVLLLGLFGLYFVDAAFKIEIFHAEILIHSTIRFFTGFFVIGILYFYTHKIRFKSLVALVFGLLIADDVVDYFRHVESFNAEAILFSFYMLLWGSVTGYVFMKQVKKYRDQW
ncbi:MAG: hypothetical protein WC782_04585 [Methylococcaceae bacterium]|jgi:hypothetical protein